MAISILRDAEFPRWAARTGRRWEHRFKRALCPADLSTRRPELGRQDELDREFREGRLGFQVSGSWLFRSIPRDSPGLRYGVALIPRPESERKTPENLSVKASNIAGNGIVQLAGSEPGGHTAPKKLLV